MPVMGPNKELSDKQSEEAFKKIMALLKEEYGVSRLPTLNPPFPAVFQKEWDEAEKRLKEAVYDIIWAEHCQSW